MLQVIATYSQIHTTSLNHIILLRWDGPLPPRPAPQKSLIGSRIPRTTATIPQTMEKKKRNVPIDRTSAPIIALFSIKLAFVVVTYDIAFSIFFFDAYAF